MTQTVVKVPNIVVIFQQVEEWIRQAYPFQVAIVGDECIPLRQMRGLRRAVGQSLAVGPLGVTLPLEYVTEAYAYAIQHDPSIRWGLFRGHLEYLLGRAFVKMLWV